ADFGGRQIVHGHTPISSMRRCLPEEVVEPLVYAGGLCVNVDGGMYLGGPGFVYQVPVLV
ncbi:MAG TPA: serine/threonine protein phosphatase, partial [Roseiflexaceae bacterium]